METFTGQKFIDRYAACPVCGDAALAHAYDIALFSDAVRFDRCGRCGLVFQNPRMTPEFIAHSYAATNYFGNKADTRQSAYTDYSNRDWLRLRQSRRRLDKIMVGAGIRGGRLLDIGCATGFFGKVAQDHGFAVKGVEPDPMVSEYGRTAYGLDIETATIETATLQPGSYDVVTLWGTDSHFLSPCEGFQRIATALKPGGVLAMNYQAFDHWIRILFPGLKKGWNSMYNLTDKALDILFERVGLRTFSRTLEWQWVTSDHITRLVKHPLPKFLGGIPLLAPAISFRYVLARRA